MQHPPIALSTAKAENAFRLLGKSHIPVLLVNVTYEDTFIMSLAEIIARVIDLAATCRSCVEKLSPRKRSMTNQDHDASLCLQGRSATSIYCSKG